MPLAPSAHDQAQIQDCIELVTGRIIPSRLRTTLLRPLKDRPGSGHITRACLGEQQTTGGVPGTA